MISFFFLITLVGYFDSFSYFFSIFFCSIYIMCVCVSKKGDSILFFSVFGPRENDPKFFVV